MLRHGGDARWQLALDRGEAGLFSKLVALGSGAAVRVKGGLGEVMALGLMADRYQVGGCGGAADGGEVRRGAGVEQRERA